MDRKMSRGCCRSASSRTLLLGLTERGRDAAALPTLSVRGGGGCRRVNDDSAGHRASVAPVAACRRRCCRAAQFTLPSLPPLLLLLATAWVVAETATVGQRSPYRRQKGDNFAPYPPPPLSLEQQQASSASDSRRSPFTAPAAPGSRSKEQKTGGGGGDADAVDLWPSYRSPAEHLTVSSKRSRRQLVERCATKISGTGYFLTPQYPQLVTDGGYTCFWQLSVVYAGQTVSLDLSDLQTSRGDGGQPDDCGDSYVAVADLSGHVVRYCSPQPRPVLVGENVYVWASGHARASLGVRASFRSTFSAPDWNPAPTECGGRLQAGDAFATPRYPGAYPTTQTCFWAAAAAAAGRRISLIFDSFDVGRDATCESDYVTVWTSERGLMPRLCGNVIPANVSTRAYIFVFFSSDGADDGGATGFRARFVTDGETGAYTTTEVTTAKTTIGSDQLTVSGATSAQPWSSAEPQAATSALPANASPSASPSASPAPPSSSQPTEPTGDFSSSGSSRSASSEPSTTAFASTSTSAGGGSNASPSSWGTTPPTDGEGTKTTSTTAAALTTLFENVSGVRASTEPPRPSASSSFYVSRTTTTTATLDRTSSTVAAGATATSPRPASSSVAVTGSRSTIRSSQALGDSSQVTTSPATVQPESEISSSSPPPSLATTPQPGGGGTSSTPQRDVSSSSTIPLPTVSATTEQRIASTAQQPPRTVPPTPEASAASSTPTTTIRRRCKLRQKSPAEVAAQSTDAPPR